MKPKAEVSADERYLKQATRGLWGRKQREVREELEAHLHERVMAHRIAGLSETDAVERALAELGNPREVSAGMARLYTLPTVMGSGVALAATCIAVVALLPNGVAQSLPGTFYWPSAECVKTLEADTKQPSGNDCFSADNSLWINQQALRRALEPQGVAFSKTSGNSIHGLLGLTFPGSTPVYIPLGPPDVSVMDETGRNIAPVPRYQSFWDFVKAASYQKDLRIEVEGWDNPTVHFNTASLQIGTDARPMAGIEFYENYLDAVFFKDLISPVPGDHVYNVNPRLDRLHNPAFDETALRNVSISLPGSAPGVYGIITRLEVGGPFSYPVSSAEISWDVSFMLSVARSDANGTVSFELPKGPLRFVDAFSAEQPQGTSILVQLGGGAGMGGGWYEVIAPERVAAR